MIKRATYKSPDPVSFTQDGYDKLKVRQAELLAKREVVLVALQRAREMGDLSENGAYTSAKFELGNVDRELRRLEFNIKYGQVVTPQHDGKIGFGSVVTVELEGKEYVYTLVGTQESDPKKGVLSLASPFGQVLLGRQAGERVEVKTSERQVVYIIRKVE